MRWGLGRASVVVALISLSSSWAAGWATALHVATGHHHEHHATEPHEALDLEATLHGHPHAEGAPAHGHPLVSALVAAIPGRSNLRAPAAAIPAGPSAACPTNAMAERLRPSRAGTNHDPPPRTPLVLRV